MKQARTDTAYLPGIAAGASLKTCVTLQYVRSLGSGGSTLAVTTSLPAQLISTNVYGHLPPVPSTYQYFAVNDAAARPLVGESCSSGPTVDGGGGPAKATGDPTVATTIATRAIVTWIA